MLCYLRGGSARSGIRADPSRYSFRGYTEWLGRECTVDREPRSSDNGQRDADEGVDEAVDEGLDEIDLTDAASFPASDPPAWAAASATHAS